MDELSPMDVELKQRAWLAAYRETPTIKYANEKAEVDRSTVRKWMENESFLQDMRDAEADADDRVEEHLYNIALGKVKKPILDKTGKQVTVSSEDGTVVTPAWEIIRSDAISLAVARARMPEKYADSVHLDLASLSDEQIRHLGKKTGAF